MARDYYEVLGVERTIDAPGLKAAYRKLAMIHHPDRNGGSEESMAKFKELSEAKTAVLSHLEGLNHTYLHEAADLEVARAVVLNAKMRRVSVCGATETLLVDREVAERLLPPITADLIAAGCELRGDEAARALELLRPRVAIPMHYATFPPLTGDPEVFRIGGSLRGVDVRVLAPGEATEL